MVKHKKPSGTYQVIRPSQPNKGVSEPDRPLTPCDSIAVEYLVCAGTHYFVVVDESLSGIGITKTPPASVYSGSRGLTMLLRELFARLNVPVRLSSNGGPEFTSQETQKIFKRWGIQCRRSSVSLPSSNGGGEISVKAIKRQLRGNIRETGSPDTDKVTTALRIDHKTPEDEPPAEMVRVTNNLWDPEGREWWFKEGTMMRNRCLKNRKGSPAAEYRHRPLTEHTKVLIQSQTGEMPGGWDSTGVVVEVLPLDQYVVTTYGSGRPTRRNRKSLWAYAPTLVEEELRSLYNQDREVARGLSFLYIQDADGNCGVDSAWGARDHRSQSADVSAGQSDEPVDSGNGTQGTTLPDNQEDIHGESLESSRGEGDLEADQSGIPRNLAKGDLRRLTRTSRERRS